MVRSRIWHGVYFPTGYTVAVIDGLAEAGACVRELVEAGVPTTDVQLVTGDEAIEIHRRQRASAGVLDRVVGVLPTDERSIQGEYLVQADEGSHFVVFRSHDEDQEARARRILAGPGARGMRHYGRWSWDDVS